jgi:hypothetical protein
VPHANTQKQTCTEYVRGRDDQNNMLSGKCVCPLIFSSKYIAMFSVLYNGKKLQHFRDFVFKAESKVKNYLERPRKQLNDLEPPHIFYMLHYI